MQYRWSEPASVGRQGQVLRKDGQWGDGASFWVGTKSGEGRGSFKKINSKTNNKKK